MSPTTHPGSSTCLWFDGNGHAAATFYCALFDDAEITSVFHQLNPDGSKGAPLVTAFRVGDQRFEALDGGAHFALTPAVSITVRRSTQDEIDRLWSALADGGTEMQCGWLTDRFGLSWQIVPTQLYDYLASPDRAVAGRVMAAMMTMVKFDIAELVRAANSA